MIYRVRSFPFKICIFVVRKCPERGKKLRFILWNETDSFAAVIEKGLVFPPHRSAPILGLNEIVVPVARQQAQEA